MRRIPGPYSNYTFNNFLIPVNGQSDRPILVIRRTIGKFWKLLPRSMRRRIVRLTQTNFTVSVAAVVVNDDRKVLLLNHVLRPRSGWGFPGGFLDADESASDAIKREVKEETGIGLSNLMLYRVLTNGTHVEIIFSARPIGVPKVQSSEIYELSWFDVDSFPDGTTIAQKMLSGEVLKVQFDNHRIDY